MDTRYTDLRLPDDKLLRQLDKVCEKGLWSFLHAIGHNKRDPRTFAAVLQLCRRHLGIA